MKRTLAVCLAAFTFFGSVTPCWPLDKRYPDWPCKQLKVPVLSAAAIWAGPPIDHVGNAWEQAPGLPELVARLAARRTPMAQAEKDIANYLTGTAEEKQEKAKLLFAGLLETLNTQRTEVMTGLERASRKQKEFAETIREEVEKIGRLQDFADSGSAPDRRTGPPDRMGDAYLRRQAKDDELCLRGAGRNRAAPFRAEPRHPERAWIAEFARCANGSPPPSSRKGEALSRIATNKSADDYAIPARASLSRDDRYFNSPAGERA